MEKTKARKLYEDYNLEPSDIFSLKFGNKSIPLILRSGIEKIQAKRKLYVTHELLSSDLSNIIIKTTAEDKETGIFVETFGEASPKNTTQSYPVAIAEKRGLSRAVLKITGFYENGFYSEDEFSDEYKEAIKNKSDVSKFIV